MFPVWHIGFCIAAFWFTENALLLGQSKNILLSHRRLSFQIESECVRSHTKVLESNFVLGGKKGAHQRKKPTQQTIYNFHLRRLNVSRSSPIDWQIVYVINWSFFTHCLDRRRRGLYRRRWWIYRRRCRLYRCRCWFWVYRLCMLIVINLYPPTPYCPYLQ